MDLLTCFTGGRNDLSLEVKQSFGTKLHQRAVERKYTLGFCEDDPDVSGSLFELLVLIVFPYKRLNDSDTLDILLNTVVELVIHRETFSEYRESKSSDKDKSKAEYRDNEYKNYCHLSAHDESHGKGKDEIERRSYSSPYKHHERHLDILDIRCKSCYKGCV